MEIGETIREFTIEPIEDPFKREVEEPWAPPVEVEVEDADLVPA